MGRLDEFGDIASLVDRLDGRSRPLVALALVCVVIALGWVVVVKPRDIVALAPPMALVALALLLMVAAAIVEVSILRPRGEQRTSAPGGEYLAGCWLGRQTVTCGILRVVGTGAGLPSAEQVSRFVEAAMRQLPSDAKGSDRVFQALADVILEAIREAERRAADDGLPLQLASIGIGTPGVIDPTTGDLTLSVTFPTDEDIRARLARELTARDPLTIGRVFNTPPGSERQLAARIWLDNDVRCIARHQLSERGWMDFACLYVGEGVGSAVVFDGRIHYGARGLAGHLGHVDLGPRALVPLFGDQRPPEPVRCDCGALGFHADALASYGGLRCIAARLARDGRDEDPLAALQEEYQLRGHAPHDFWVEAFPEVVTHASGRGAEELPDAIRRLIAHRPDVAAYLNDALEAYAAVIAAVLATIVHAFDPVRVVFCGPLVEQLRRNERFDQILPSLLREELLYSSAVPARHFARADETLWHGAALLGWDPTYHQRLERSRG